MLAWGRVPCSRNIAAIRGRTVNVPPDRVVYTAMDLEELEEVAGDLSQEEREAVARILREVADWLESTSSPGG